MRAAYNGCHESDASISVNVVRDANSAWEKNRLLRAVLATKLRRSSFNVSFTDPRETRPRS